MFGKKKKTDSLQSQVKRTEEIVHKLDEVNNMFMISLMNTNQQKVTVKK